ncbi:hypothetical protein HWB39_gp22 [Streptomyces phage WRightOn]|jgi:hypothetical protein|uniref:Uncharacterized protein n=4 Tax=Caudoviricetes TaxID=2731619 RepID=A0A2H4PI72_9CAUD|nr:hypothetical protein HWB39_gp22 [Streptomyces phage WRightOn]YP_009856784.1 hypothetical protein HWD10_gp46 [Streptomyces phage JXY1]ATW62514.1 hypothetical protein SEA_WRIGHTON_81 [Streptomyces phage WRightOn]QIA28831.1 hypothetical protein [Streptomyces phage JXY1]QNN98998.1 hypothetical protein SEA_ZEIGLE_77 [Streptomyces phage Zeigle]
MCGVDICPVHTRTNAMDEVKSNVPARAITYVGDYAVVTMDNPSYGDPMSLISAMLGGEPPKMFMHMVTKVGPTKPIGDLSSVELKDNEVFRETFLDASDPRLEPFMDSAATELSGETDEFNAELTKIFQESHELVVASVKNGVIS